MESNLEINGTTRADTRGVDDNSQPKQPRGYRNYNPNPNTPTGIENPSADLAGTGYEALVAAIAWRLEAHTPTKRGRKVVAIDLYHSPYLDEFLSEFRQTWERSRKSARWIDTRLALKDPDVLGTELQEFLTDDPVFGRVCDRDLSIFFESSRWQSLAEQVNAEMKVSDEGPLFIIGPGALLSPFRMYTDVALYVEVPREIIFIASEANIGRNLGDDQDRGKWPRYKRSFYVDWPVQNRHMFEVLPICDLIVDMHDLTAPAFVDWRLLMQGMSYAAQRSFRVRSLFMPGVWGGRRLQNFIPDLPADWPNCAWGFEVVAPENTITFNFGSASLSVAFDVFMHFEAPRILGRDNFRRFGDYFPIRFDFLDTMQGTNLSCQVHPPDAYINAHFREPFAQHEMYYMIESKPGAKVYLGIRESTDREAFLTDVARAQSESIPFEISKHVNEWDATRGDLFMIPAGTVHCSGADNLVLEISATPYIYTFKIYDYLRKDLSGQPRPISYQRAFEVIDFTRKTDWVSKNLVAKPKLIDQGAGWQRYMLSDLALEFHNVERIEFTKSYQDTTEEYEVHLLCVVEGEGARVVRNSDGSTLELSYAETGIIPADCGTYRLEPIGDVEVKVVKCYVRM